MSNDSEAFVAFDTSKSRHAVAIAEGRRDGEVRYLGEIDNSDAAVVGLIKKVAAKYGKGDVLLRGRSDRLWSLSADPFARP